jgi:sRNA-binding carbon storage regulator CsrA
MLILTRKPGDVTTFMLPDGQAVRVHHLPSKSRNVMKIGIESPREVRIDRAARPDKQQQK